MANLLERARADVAAGRLWKARERLEGSLANDAANQDVLTLLGEISFRMGDLPTAGPFWFLTDAAGHDVAGADAALHERYPTARALFTALPLKAPLNAYPPRVQTRVEALLHDPDAEWLWSKKLAALGRKRRRARDIPAHTGDNLLVGTLGALAVLPWLVGVATLCVLLVRLVGSSRGRAARAATRRGASAAGP